MRRRGHRENESEVRLRSRTATVLRFGDEQPSTRASIGAPLPSPPPHRVCAPYRLLQGRLSNRGTNSPSAIPAVLAGCECVAALPPCALFPAVCRELYVNRFESDVLGAGNGYRQGPIRVIAISRLANNSSDFVKGAILPPDVVAQR